MKPLLPRDAAMDSPLSAAADCTAEAVHWFLPFILDDLAARNPSWPGWVAMAYTGQITLLGLVKCATENGKKHNFGICCVQYLLLIA
jgi:hypothetical protein